MSKYIKLEDALKICQPLSNYSTAIKEVLELLPTIEVSEEVLKATKKFNAYTIADENAEMGMRTQIEPIIEISEDFVKDTDVPISEDCISKASVISALSLYRKTIETELDSRVSVIADIVLDTIDDCIELVGKAPSVTTEQSCDTCKYRELYECSDCRFASKWERIDE